MRNRIAMKMTSPRVAMSVPTRSSSSVPWVLFLSLVTLSSLLSSHTVNGFTLIPGYEEGDILRDGLSFYPPNLSDDTIPIDSPGAPKPCSKIHDVVFLVDFLCDETTATIPNILVYSSGAYRYMKPSQTSRLFKRHYINDWIESLSNQTQLTQGDVYVATKHGIRHWFEYDSSPLESSAAPDNATMGVVVHPHMNMEDGQSIGSDEICHLSSMDDDENPLSSSSSSKEQKSPRKQHSSTATTNRNHNNDGKTPGFSLPSNVFHKILSPSSIKEKQQPQSHQPNKRQQIDYMVMVSTSGLSRMLTEKHLQWLYSVPTKVIWIIMDPTNENMEVIHYTAGRRVNRDYFIALKVLDVKGEVANYKNNDNDVVIDNNSTTTTTIINNPTDDLGDGGNASEDDNKGDLIGDAIPGPVIVNHQQQQQKQKQLVIPEHRSKFRDVLRNAIQNSVCCDENKDETQCGLCGGAFDVQETFCTDQCRSGSSRSDDSYRYDICGVCNGDGSSCSPPVVSEVINSRIYNLNDFWIENQYYLPTAGDYSIELCFHGDYFAKGTSVQFGPEGDNAFFSRPENRNSSLVRLDYYPQRYPPSTVSHDGENNNSNNNRWVSFGHGKMCANYTISELEGRFPGQKSIDIRVFDKHTFYKLSWNTGGKWSSFITPPERRVEFAQVTSKSVMYFAGDIGIKQVIYFRASDEMHVDSIEEFPLNDVGAIPFMLVGKPQVECIEVATTVTGGGDGDSHSSPLPFECKLELEFDTRDALGVVVFENMKYLRIILKSQRDPKFYHVLLDECQIFFRKHNDPYVDNQLGFRVELFQDPEQTIPLVKSKNSAKMDVYGMASLRQPTYRIYVDYVIRCYALNGDILPYDSSIPHASGCNTPNLNIVKEVLLFPNGTTASDFTPLHSPNEFSYRFRFSSIETFFDQVIQIHWHIELLEGSIFVPFTNYYYGDENVDSHGDGGGGGLFAGLTDVQLFREEIMFGGHNEYRMSEFSKQIHSVMTDQRIYHKIYPFPYRSTVYSLPLPESFYNRFKQELEFHLEQEENYNRILGNDLEGELKKGKSPYSTVFHYVFYYPNDPGKSVGQYRLGGARTRNTDADIYLTMLTVFLILMICLLPVFAFAVYSEGKKSLSPPPPQEETSSTTTEIRLQQKSNRNNNNDAYYYGNNGSGDDDMMYSNKIPGANIKTRKIKSNIQLIP